MDKFDIANPEIIEIVRQIKSIQKRISQPDLVDKTPLQIFQALETEYHDFSCKFPSIYKNIVKRKNLDTIASALYCRDKVLRGLMDEQELAASLHLKYMPNQ